MQTGMLCAGEVEEGSRGHGEVRTRAAWAVSPTLCQRQRPGSQRSADWRLKRASQQATGVAWAGSTHLQPILLGCIGRVIHVDLVLQRDKRAAPRLGGSHGAPWPGAQQALAAASGCKNVHAHGQQLGKEQRGTGRCITFIILSWFKGCCFLNPRLGARRPAPSCVAFLCVILPSPLSSSPRTAPPARPQWGRSCGRARTLRHSAQAGGSAAHRSVIGSAGRMQCGENVDV